MDEIGSDIADAFYMYEKYPTEEQLIEYDNGIFYNEIWGKYDIEEYFKILRSKGEFVYRMPSDPLQHIIDWSYIS